MEKTIRVCSDTSGSITAMGPVALGAAIGTKLDATLFEKLAQFIDGRGLELALDDIAYIAPRLGWGWEEERLLDYLYNKYRLLKFKGGKYFTVAQLSEKWPMVPPHIFYDIIDNVDSGELILVTVRDFVGAIQARRPGMILSYSEAELR